MSKVFYVTPVSSFGDTHEYSFRGLSWLLHFLAYGSDTISDCNMDIYFLFDTSETYIIKFNLIIVNNVVDWRSLLRKVEFARVAIGMY